MCTSVWTGFDRKARLKDKNGVGITGGRAAAPIWTDFMTRALKGEPERDFRIPKHIRFALLNPETGCEVNEPAASASPDTAAQDPEDRSAAVIRVALKPDQVPCREEHHDSAP